MLGKNKFQFVALSLTLIFACSCSNNEAVLCEHRIELILDHEVQLDVEQERVILKINSGDVTIERFKSKEITKELHSILLSCYLPSQLDWIVVEINEKNDGYTHSMAYKIVLE